jgi:uncharacterized protein
MKYLLVLFVVAIGLWLVNKRLRGPARREPRPTAPPGGPKLPDAMLACAHCGLHLPATDALRDGDKAYCSDAHRRLGPGSGAA